MTDLTRKSINNFVKELKMRISLLTSASTRANLDEDSYNKVNEIIYSYTKNTPSKLRTIDLFGFSKNDVVKILKTIGLDQQGIKRIADSFDQYLSVINNGLNGNKMKEAESFFESIRKMIDDYLTDYQNIKNSQNDMQSKKVKEYTRYINIFETESFDELFDEIDDLVKLMSSIALDGEDRWRILEYIASKNIDIEKSDIFDINLAKKVSTYIDRYLLKNPEEVEIVKNSLAQTELDVDLIPSITKVIAKEYELSENVVKNILCAIVLNSLYEKYRDAIKNDEPDDFIDYLKSMIDIVLSYDVMDDNKIVERARQIITETSSLFSGAIASDEESLKEYIDSSISELIENGLSRDEAIDRKLMPIIKTISNSLEKLESLELDSEDYELCCGIISDLIDEYDKIDGKKQMGLKRIN